MTNVTEEQRSSSHDNPATGAVLVVGGGIAGMQAALDLADGGFRVYLSEDSPGIGGRMARLDKTFPTNDCSMCIMSPKLVEAGRHLDIEVMPTTRLIGLDGEPGQFVARLEVDARGVEIGKCTACGDCEPVCPVRLPDEFDSGLRERHAIYRLYPQSVPNAYAIDKRGTSPCRAGCPAGVNTHAYTALIRARKYAEALSVIYRRLPLPASLGRVCPHPCESECHRGQVDEPVSLCALKRFVADRVAEDCPESLPSLPDVLLRDERVAIVGAGPGGLACAYALRRHGVRVTIFEARDVAGGMMVAGIPEYRLPREVLAREVDIIVRSGVEIRYGHALGREFSLSDLLSEYQAVFLAIGAGGSVSAGIPGEALSGVSAGIEFLEGVNLKGSTSIGRRVLVIGGGNTAMDAARTALRLGAATVTVAYRRSESEITALPEELAEAREEGVVFEFLTAPVELLAGDDGRVSRARLIRNQLGDRDASGRPRPVPIPGSEYEIEVDTVLLAIGQRPVLELEPVDSLELRRDGTIATTPDLRTSMERVFAGGDAVTGPARAIDAIAAGNLAAASILSCLGIEPDADVSSHTPSDPEQLAPIPIPADELEAPWSKLERLPRAQAAHSSLHERRTGFTEVNPGLTERQAIAEAGRCLDCGGCCECMECVTACGPRAIDHTSRTSTIELEVGAVVLAPGYDLFDPTGLGEYGYGIYPNVLTSMEFERMLSASGPTGGHLERADGQTPARVAFIQCVGSRDERAQQYCSAVCCMHATKEAVIAQEHAPGLKTTILFNDLRAFGKEFERYYERAEREYGVRYIRCMASSVRELPSGELSIRFRADDGTITEETFDLVVLSIGLRPSVRGLEAARALGVELGAEGFCRTPEFDAVATSRPGVYVAGCFSEPKDIPETVIEASAAAGAAATLLAASRGQLTRTKEYPPERDVSSEPPRIGVFVCHCGLNIASVIDVDSVAEFSASLPDVAFADHYLYTCAQDSIARIKERIAEHNLNRVVVASCTPRTHEPLFRETIREAGLNPYLFELANIREQASWVHQSHPAEATAKARDLVAMAVAKSRLLTPLSTPSFSVMRRALVIGGGVAGMSAAATIGGQGYEVDLIEREPELGGLFPRVTAEPDGTDPASCLAEMTARVTDHPLIRVWTGSRVVETQGYVGNFRSVVDGPGGRVEVEHGAVVIATGGAVSNPAGKFGYGSDGRIMTLHEWEDNGRPGQTVTFIQCVGSRDDEHPYCSRVCCTSSIKEAIRLRREGRNAIILFRDIRTYGFRERLYREARELGVLFIRYERDDPPEVSVGSSQLEIRVTDHRLGERVILQTDALVLAAGISPGDNAGISQLFKVPLTGDGFFAEAHAKLRPNEFAADGVYVCGLAHAPKFGREAMAQGQAAGNKAASLLSRDALTGQAIIATVNERLCKGCGACIGVCPYDAREIDDRRRVATVTEILCQGCGACVVACPNGAAGQRGFERRQILAMIGAACDLG